MREPPMSHEAFQRIIDLRLNNWELTEEDYINSSLYFDWRDIFAGQQKMKQASRAIFATPEPRYFPRYLRQGISDDEFWDGWVEYRTPILVAAYADIMRRKDELIRCHEEYRWKGETKKSKNQEKVKPTQLTLMGEPAA